MNHRLWTAYDDKISDCKRQIKQLEILIENENWKEYSREEFRKDNIDKLKKQLNKVKRELNRNIELRNKSL